MTKRLDVSIGPVQGFVAQSRRTRDLWGSSYLLSFLSAHAMHGVVKAGGRVIEPVVDDDPLYKWVRNCREGDAPLIGSLPNRFAVEVGVDGDPQAIARAGVDALHAAWKRVSDAVWAGFVQHACPMGNGTEQIWQRQVDGFWEVTWTAGASADEGGHLLARRKHWRSHRLPDEPGDKCTVMHDLQELSGYVRSQGHAKRQDRFWDHVCRRRRTLDVQDKERLCAIALVKRLFPKVAARAIGWHVEATHWPSTVHIAARPWICQVQGSAAEKARNYAEAVKKVAPEGVLSERQWTCTDENSSSAGNFSRLDANYYHRTFVASEQLCPLGKADGDARGQLAEQLKAIYNAKDKTDQRVGLPPSFYALLLADGDRLGRLAGTLGKEDVGKALATFTGKVPEIVREHGGETIYAGGDDVLAMHPVPQALECATGLAKCYGEAFSDAPGATLSAAVVFAHIRLPLGTVIDEAHRLLDKVAKDDNGRNSLAVGVLKPGGLNCQWVTTWERTQPLPPNNASLPAIACLNDLIASLKTTAGEPGLSSALIYRIRETLTRLCDWEAWRPGSWGAVPTDLDVPTLLRAEIGHSLEVRMGEAENMKERTAKLTDLVWHLMQRSRAPSDDNNHNNAEANGSVVEAGIDALLLARCLAHTMQEETDR